MPISMECPSCMNGFSVPDEAAGRKTKCPDCQFVLFVPRPDTHVDAAPPAATTKADAPAPSAAPVEVIEAVEAVRPAPSKKSRAVSRAPAAGAPAGDNPFAFNDSDGDPLHPRRRRRRTSWATILIVGFLVVALGGLLLLAGGGVALWYFLSRPSATPAVTDASGGPAEKAESAVSEPKADDKDATKKEPPRKDTPKEDPKNPGKPVRDPVEPGPPADPKPTKGKLTLLPVPEQNVKPGDQFTFNVSLRREDCKGDVALEIRGGEFGIKVNRSLVLPADVDRTTLTAEVLENAPIGKHVLTVSAKLGALNTYTAFEVLVQKPGAPVPVNPPPDAGPAPLQMLNARINVDGRVYEGHKGAVECVALSGDKKWAASGGVDGFVRLLDLDKGQSAVIHIPEAKVPDAITAVAFSADGKWLAFGDAAGFVYVHDVAGNQSRRMNLNKLPGGAPPKDNPVRSVDLSPKGDTVVATTKLYISSWEAATGKQVAVNDTVQNPGRVRFAADGARCYAVSGPNVAVFDPQRGDVTFLGGAPGKPAAFFAATFDTYPARGELVAVVQKDNKVELDRINLKTALAVKEAELPADSTCVAVADRAGGALVGDKQGNVHVYVIDAGKELVRLSPHKAEVRGVAVSADGRRAVSAGADGTVAVYDLRNEGDKPVPPPPPRPVPPAPPAPAAAPAYERKAEAVVHKGEGRHLAFSPDGRWLVSGGKDGKAAVLDAATGKVVKELERQSKEVPVAALSFSGDGKWLLVANEGKANEVGYGVLWEVDGWKLKGLLQGGHKNQIVTASLSQDGKRALTFGFVPNAIVSWDATAPRVQKRIDDAKLTTHGPAVSADALLAVTNPSSVPGPVRVWNLNTGKVVAQAEAKRLYNGFAFSDDGKRVVAWGAEPALVVFDVDNFAKPKVLVERGTGHAAALSHDGKLAVVALATDEVEVWDVDKGALVCRAPKADRRPSAVAFSRQADRLAVADHDGRVYLYARADAK